MRSRLPDVDSRGASRFLVAVLVTLAVSCNEFSAPPLPPPGDARISATAVGLDVPLVLGVTFDGGTPKGFVPSGFKLVSDLAPGHHTVQLEVPANCTLAGPNPLDITVTSRETTEVSFSLTCTAASAVLGFFVGTIGVDYPLTFTLRVGSVKTVLSIYREEGFVEGLPAGTHLVELQNVPPNCTISGENPISVEVTTGGQTRDTVETRFDVTCVSVAGVVEVAVRTTGEDLTLVGYTLRVGGVARTAGINETMQVYAGSGEQQVLLDDLPSNCLAAGSNSRSVTVTTGGLTRDTVRTAFDVTCSRYDMIGFTRSEFYPGTRPATMNANGTSVFQLAVDAAFGSWFPDGRKAVITTLDCYYYYYYCTSTGLAIVTLDSLPKFNVQQLTTNSLDGSPTISPSGNRIAFMRGQNLTTMNVDGSVPTTLVVPLALDNLWEIYAPSWSPDGSRLVFECVFGKSPRWTDICTVNADGSNLTRVTADPFEDHDPSWSPDGTKILLASNRGTLALQVGRMNADGTAFVPLTPGRDPALSKDGSKIAFVRDGPGQGLHVMNADGTNVIRLTTTTDYGPVWRP